MYASIVMSEPNAGAALCANCGAPDGGELVLCRYCAQAVSAEAQASAIPCPNPQCRTLCRWGKQNCVKCKTWLVVSCVFCGSLSPHNVSNCLSCREAFAGAPQRKAQMEASRQQQQNMQNAQVWGNLAIGALGVAGGIAASSSWSSGSSDSGGGLFDSFSSDDSGGGFSAGEAFSSDDGFDFGGDD